MEKEMNSGKYYYGKSQCPQERRPRGRGREKARFVSRDKPRCHPSQKQRDRNRPADLRIQCRQLFEHQKDISRQIVRSTARYDPVVEGIRLVVEQHHMKLEDTFYLSPHDGTLLELPTEVFHKLNFGADAKTTDLQASRQIAGFLAMQLRKMSRYYTVLSMLCRRNVVSCCSGNLQESAHSRATVLVERMLLELEEIEREATEVLEKSKRLEYESHQKSKALPVIHEQLEPDSGVWYWIKKLFWMFA